MCIYYFYVSNVKNLRMRNSFLLYVVALVMGLSFVGTSCKKPVHSNAPTPNNERMLSYNKITTIQWANPAVNGELSKITENFRFNYDNLNRLVKITYTGNDSFEIHKFITFDYSKPDTVIKKTVNLLTNVIVEMDTFKLNNEGMVIKSYTPNMITSYEYLGRLMTRATRVGTSYRNITVTDFSKYTSVNGDFLKHSHDGNLNITLDGMTLPLKMMKILTYPKDKDTVFLYQYNNLVHNRTNTYLPTYIYAKDTVNKADSLMYPGLTWVNEGYHFYTEKANRIGDWLQLESFTMFGRNIFQNAHLVESVTSRNRSASIYYNIDAFSKITQTRVEEVDSMLNKFITVYDIQYETF